jgi:sulfite reductase (ferredoxin)
MSRKSQVASSQLRHPLPEQLANDEIFINENAVQIMKFHGSYQQDNREMRAPGQQKKFQFMLRLKMPAGDFPAALYQNLDDLADRFGNGTLRATTRCAWQMHGILKGDLKPVFASIMNSGGSTVGACGDLSRNVMTTPAPFVGNQYAHARFVSKMLGEIFAPQTGAFSEIWLDGEKAASLEYWKTSLNMDDVKRILAEDNGNGVVFPGHEEPIYGETYLPRKFKIGVTVPGDNSIDVYTQDIGIVVLSDSSGRISGYNLIVGGGMGRTHKKESTFARTGDHLGFVPAEKLWDACKAIVAAQRDHGNREVRANARMKYLVDKLGIASFRKLVETYYGHEFEPFRELPPWKYEDWLGWHQQGDGNVFLGLFVENGRIKDEGQFRLKSGLRRVIDAYGFDMVVTPNQNIILKNITPNQQAGVEAILKEHGVKLVDEYDPNLRISMACPAMPLCGLAVTEAERHMPSVVMRMSNLFKTMGAFVPITMRMTGCPNGCARPYMAEIGFVGSGPGAYQLWLGGCPNQTRLAFPVLEKVKDEDLETTISPILAMFKEKKLSVNEQFGDFCARMGKAELVSCVESAGALEITAAAASTNKRNASLPVHSLDAKLPENATKSIAAAPSALVTRGPPRVTVVNSAENAKVASQAQSTAPAPPIVPAPVVAELKPKKGGRKKSIARPRLTVNPDIMERLKNIAALRDMSASQVADEIITTYLSGFEDEDFVEDGSNV